VHMLAMQSSLRWRGENITHSRILFLLHQQRIFLVSCKKQSTYLLSSQGFKTRTLWPTQSNLINKTLPGKVQISFTLTNMPPAQFFFYYYYAFKNKPREAGRRILETEPNCTGDAATGNGHFLLFLTSVSASFLCFSYPKTDGIRWPISPILSMFACFPKQTTITWQDKLLYLWIMKRD